MPREDILFFLCAECMTEENYDLLDEFESRGEIDKLTSKTVNTFVFYSTPQGVRVALSNLSMETCFKRLHSPSPYIRL